MKYLIILICALTLVGCARNDSENSSNVSQIDTNEDNSAVAGSKEVIPIETIIPWDEMMLFDQAYCMADANQRKQLDALKEKYGIVVDWYVKEIKTIMNELDDPSAKITLEQAKEICNTFVLDTNSWDAIINATNNIAKAFDEYAGAPDYYGGNDYPKRRYYIGDDQTERIEVWDTMVWYTNDDGYTTEIIYTLEGRLPEENVTEANSDLNAYYEEKYASADAGQKKQLDKLLNEHPDDAGCYEKTIKLIMGEVDKDIPWISLERARELITKVTYDDLSDIIDWDRYFVELLNAETGAPDYNYPLIVPYKKYYVNGDKDKYIKVEMGSVIYMEGQKEIEWLFPYEGL